MTIQKLQVRLEVLGKENEAEGEEGGDQAADASSSTFDSLTFDFLQTSAKQSAGVSVGTGAQPRQPRPTKPATIKPTWKRSSPRSASLMGHNPSSTSRSCAHTVFGMAPRFLQTGSHDSAMSPGPGSYRQHTAMGVQIDSTKRSYPTCRF